MFGQTYGVLVGSSIVTMILVVVVFGIALETIRLQSATIPSKKTSKSKKAK
ncbi:MAG TPA: hypothetical protein VI912_04960 [Candidatus Bilamarchaeaceae archaeon]|nr:hypothetical protein [Candidatus Bilamarchaeaceae archaeon]